MALGPGKPGGKKSLDELQRKAAADHPSAHANDVHVVVLHALPRGEDVVDEPGANPVDLVGRDAGADAAAAERHTTLDLAGGERSGQGNYEIGVVVREVQRMRAEVEDLCPELRNFAAISFVNANPPWSEAILGAARDPPRLGHVEPTGRSRRGAPEDRQKLLGLQARATHQGASDPRQRQD